MLRKNRRLRRAKATLTADHPDNTDGQGGATAERAKSRANCRASVSDATQESIVPSV